MINENILRQNANLPLYFLIVLGVPAAIYLINFLRALVSPVAHAQSHQYGIEYSLRWFEANIEKIRDELTCPLSLEIMMNPQLLSSGHNVDQPDVARRLPGMKCMITRLRITSITPNTLLRKTAEWFSKYTQVVNENRLNTSTADQLLYQLRRIVPRQMGSGDYQMKNIVDIVGSSVHIVATSVHSQAPERRIEIGEFKRIIDSYKSSRFLFSLCYPEVQALKGLYKTSRAQRLTHLTLKRIQEIVEVASQRLGGKAYRKDLLVRACLHQQDKTGSANVIRRLGMTLSKD